MVKFRAPLAVPRANLVISTGLIITGGERQHGRARCQQSQDRHIATERYRRAAVAHQYLDTHSLSIGIIGQVEQRRSGSIGRDLPLPSRRICARAKLPAGFST